MNNIKKMTIIIILVLIILSGVAVAMLSSTTVTPDEVGIEEVAVNENKILLKGTITGSAIGYKSYKIKNVDDKLYITIKGNTLPFGKKDGSFNIQIDEYNNIKEIYIQGKGELTKKIWSN